MNSLTCKEGPSFCGYHPSCLVPPYTFSGGPLSCGRAAPSLPLRMCEPGDGESDVDVWGWQTRVCLRVCNKMMCDGSRGRADERTCTRVFVQHTSGRVRNWVGVGNTLRGAALRILWPRLEGAGSAPGRSTRCLGRRRPLQNEMTSRVL